MESPRQKPESLKRRVEEEITKSARIFIACRLRDPEQLSPRERGKVRDAARGRNGPPSTGARLACFPSRLLFFLRAPGATCTRSNDNTRWSTRFRALRKRPVHRKASVATARRAAGRRSLDSREILKRLVCPRIANETTGSDDVDGRSVSIADQEPTPFLPPI